MEARTTKARAGKNIDSSCFFCAHLNSLDVVFEDALTAVVLHDDWSVRGHAMVIWKAHVENISQLSDEETRHFATVYRRTEGVLLELTGAERAVMLKLGIITPHLHVHIYPVSKGLDRKAVMDIIDGRVLEPRDGGFASVLKERLDNPRPPE